MKAAEIRRLAQAHDQAALEAAADALAEELPCPIEVAGEDDGERLTHLMLASRLRGMVDAGQPLAQAFREVMQGVRTVMTNED
ncbi:MAG: DUF6952 family protein [Bradymonadia bacterium]